MARPQRSGRRPYAGGTFDDPAWAPDPAKRRQARVATQNGPPPGFAPVQTPPAAPGTGVKVTDRLPAKPVTQNVDGSKAKPKGAPTSFGSSLPGGDFSGFMLGLFGTVLLLQYVHGGTAQVKKWLSAKFLNRVAGDASSGRTPTAVPPVNTYGGRPTPTPTPTPPAYNTPPSTAPVPTPGPVPGLAPTPAGGR